MKKRFLVNALVIVSMILQPLIVSNAMAKMPVNLPSSVINVNFVQNFSVDDANHRMEMPINADAGHHHVLHAADCCSTAVCCVVAAPIFIELSTQPLISVLNPSFSNPLIGISTAVEIKPPRTVSI